MKYYKDRIYLNISGFFFCLHFRRSRLAFQKEKIKKEILNNYSGFITNEVPTKIDFEIEFINRLSYQLLHDRKNNLQYVSIARNKPGSSSISIFYQTSIYQFQLILRDILLKLLSKNKGFFLHASANNYHGRAILFTGHPNAGKSTAMIFLHDKYQALTDDSAIIKKEKGKFYFYQTPMTEKAFWIKKTSKRYEIDKIFFLRKADYFKIEKITDAECFSKLLIEQFWTKNKTYMREEIKTVLEFISQFKNFNLMYFAKDKNKLLKLLTRRENSMVHSFNKN